MLTQYKARLAFMKIMNVRRRQLLPVQSPNNWLVVQTPKSLEERRFNKLEESVFIKIYTVANQVIANFSL